jgi:hypothetical protein
MSLLLLFQTPGSSTEYLRPDGNVTAGWTGGFADIDDLVPDNLNTPTDWAYSPDNGIPATLEVSLTNPIGTPTGTITVRYRAAMTLAGVGNGTGLYQGLNVSIYQGTTLVHAEPEQEVYGFGITPWQEYDFTFAANLIADWSDVRLRFVTADLDGMDPEDMRGVGVSWAAVEFNESDGNATVGNRFVVGYASLIDGTATGEGATTYTLSGVVRDGDSTPIGGADVKVFLTATHVKIAEGVTNGSGAYSIVTPTNGQHYVVAFKAGVPLLAGTTVNTLVPETA